MTHALRSQASTRDLVSWRMRALGLWQRLPGVEGSTSELAEGNAGSVQSRIARVRAVPDALFALQGQDWGAARWALGLRAPGITEADVVAAFDSGAIVRSWPMRGTIHLLAAEDLGWLQAATGRRVLSGAARRRDFIGLDSDTLTRMVDIAVSLMSGGRSISRDELAEAWVAAGIGDPEKGVGPWRYHVIWWMCQTGIAVAGPVTFGTESVCQPGANGTMPEPRLVLTEEWITLPRVYEGDEALAELAARFTRGRGAVQDRDLAWWAGLGVRDVRRGFAAAEADGRVTAIEVEGARLWADPALLGSTAAGAAAASEQSAATGPAHLLPAFDEHLLGYTDRSAVLDPAHVERVVPGRNGVFKPTITSRNGTTTGTWSRTPRAHSVRLTVTPLPGETLDFDHLQDAAAAWGNFRGAEVELVHAS